MNEKEYVRIAVKKEEGKLKIVSESVWDEDLSRDYPGTLEGMIDELYDDEDEIRDAVKQIFSDLEIDSEFDLDITYVE